MNFIVTYFNIYEIIKGIARRKSESDFRSRIFTLEKIHAHAGPQGNITIVPHSPITYLKSLFVGDSHALVRDLVKEDKLFINNTFTISIEIAKRIRNNFLDEETKISFIEECQRIMLHFETTVLPIKKHISAFLDTRTAEGKAEIRSYLNEKTGRELIIDNVKRILIEEADLEGIDRRKILWDNLNLHIEVRAEFERRLYAGIWTGSESNDWGDILQMLYVQKAMKFMTKEKKWILMIKEIGLEIYLYQSN